MVEIDVTNKRVFDFTKGIKQKQSTGGVLQKCFLKYFAKFTGKRLYWDF